MMKKIIMALAIVVGVSPMLPIAASADSMYQDIINTIVNNSLVKDDATRLDNVRKALREVGYSKDNAEYYLIRSHGNTQLADKVAGAMMASLGAIAFSLPYIDPTVTTAQSILLGGACGLYSLAFFAKQYAERYYDKKKLAELNEVIAKLEKVEAELQSKVEETQHA